MNSDRKLGRPARTGASIVATNGIIKWIQITSIIFAKLITTSLLLRALGVELYGTYFAAISLALLLGFLTSALQSASLRAIVLTSAESPDLSRVFGSLLGLHLLAAFVILAAGLILGPLIVSTVLVIPVAQLDAAQFSFICILITTAFGTLLSPYEAFLQSRERFGLFSGLEILRNWLLVPASYSLFLLDGGKLEIFAMITASITIVTMLIAVIVALLDYPVTRPHLNLLFDAKVLRLQGGIISWTIVGSVNAMARNQGLAIVVNVIGGPVASAAFAVGSQIPSALRQFATSLRIVIAPRIYGKEAQGNRSQMLGLGLTSCKASMFVLTALTIPLIVEMQTLLETWLGRADSAIVFVTSLLLVQHVIDESSAALGTVYMAIGKLARLHLIAGGISLIMLPVAYAVGSFSGNFQHSLLTSISIIAIVAIMRAKLLDAYIDGAMLRWLQETIVKSLLTFAPTLVVAVTIETLLLPSFTRIFLTFAMSGGVFLVSAYSLGLSAYEKAAVAEFWRKRGRTI